MLLSLIVFVFKLPHQVVHQSEVRTLGTDDAHLFFIPSFFLLVFPLCVHNQPTVFCPCYWLLSVPICCIKLCMATEHIDHSLFFEKSFLLKSLFKINFLDFFFFDRLTGSFFHVNSLEVIRTNPKLPTCLSKDWSGEEVEQRVRVHEEPLILDEGSSSLWHHIHQDFNHKHVDCPQSHTKHCITKAFHVGFYDDHFKLVRLFLHSSLPTERLHADTHNMRSSLKGEIVWSECFRFDN